MELDNVLRTKSYINLILLFDRSVNPILKYISLEHPHQYVQFFFFFFFNFAHLKSIFSILHTYFYKTPTSIFLLYTFIQIKYSFF